MGGGGGAGGLVWVPSPALGSFSGTQHEEMVTVNVVRSGQLFEMQEYPKADLKFNELT